MGYKMIEADYHSDVGMYAVPFMYGPVEQMILLRTNELTQYAYGRNVKILQNKMYLKHRFVAWIFSVIFFVMPSLLRWSFVRKLVIALIRFVSFEPGKGPKLEDMEASKWKETIYIQTQKNEMRCKVEIDIFGDYGYLNTSKLLVEQGILCALDRKNKQKQAIRGGFLTPAAAFGSRLPQRLNDCVDEFEIKYVIE